MRSGWLLLLGGACLVGILAQSFRTPSPSAAVPPARAVSPPTTVSSREMPVSALQPPAIPVRPLVATSSVASVKTVPADKPIDPSVSKKASKIEKEVVAAAVIVAAIIAASRSAYHSTGRPCACPDDRMRNGRSCGGKSAYSRPGGAAPLCYVHDVTPAMIENYRKTVASR